MVNILLKNSYPVNLAILGHFNDVKPAVVLGYLMNEYARYMHVSAVSEGDWFYKTVEDMEKATSYSKSQQSNAIKSLVNAGMLEYKIDKIDDKHPNRMRYFRFTQNNISTIENVVKNFNYGGQKIEPPSVKNLTTVGEKFNDGQQEIAPRSAKNLTTVVKKVDINKIYNNLYNDFYNNILPQIKKDYKQTMEGVIRYASSRDTLTVNGSKISASDFSEHLNGLKADTVNDVITNIIQQSKPLNPAYICSCLFNAIDRPKVRKRWAGYDMDELKTPEDFCGIIKGADMHALVKAEAKPEPVHTTEPQQVETEPYNQYFDTMDDEADLYNQAVDVIKDITDYDTAIKALDDLDPRWRHFDGYCKDWLCEKLTKIKH